MAFAQRTGLVTYQRLCAGIKTGITGGFSSSETPYAKLVCIGKFPVALSRALPKDPSTAFAVTADPFDSRT
ncbi:MAG: hypothetical protein E7040_07520 [Lentisphaerae bacterium]|nr:hypothetical protein [Lentisphaerota bacterium]